MNYQIYNKMDDEYMQKPEETDQEYMERVLRAVVESAPEDGRECLNDRVAPEFYECRAEEQSLCLKFVPKSWQSNPNGNLHGGMIATTLDITFGVLARFYVRDSKSVTVQLNVNYMRGIPMDHPLFVTAQADKAGKTLKFMSARIVDAETGKLAADATAVFM